MKHKILIGIDDFKAFRSSDGLYVDKSLLISEVLDNGAGVSVITRPRRFGKTLNMSMLSYFFDIKNSEENRGLFSKLDIEKSQYFVEHMGQYPVVNITFKDIKRGDWQGCYEEIVELIKVEYDKHRYLQNSSKLTDLEKNTYILILEGKANESQYRRSLNELVKYLSKFYDRKVVVLIDEYDTPVIEGELEGYFKEVVKFMQTFLSGALKGNNYLYKGIMTGIVRLEGTGIFSGLNNLDMCTVLDEKYRDKFGFTEKEVKKLLKDYDMEDMEDRVREHYNGYNFDGEVIYNPYSVVKCIDSRRLQNYWLSSSSNDLAKKKLKDMMDMEGANSAKETVEKLLRGGVVNLEIKNRTTISSSMRVGEILNLLLYAGYLKYSNYKDVGKRNWEAEVSIPNKEIESMFGETISEWIEDKYTLDEIEGFKDFLEDLCGAGEDEMKKGIERYLEKRSVMDVEKREEMGYHNFFFGMFQGLSEEYEVESNRESGEGRYDIRLTPIKGKGRKEGIVLELKVGEKDRLKDISREAVKQIEAKGYHNGFKAKGLKKARLIGVAFYKKSAEVTLKVINL